MAEGGVEQSAIAYEEATLLMCEVCLDEDSFRHADWFCKQCKQRMCDKCRKYHLKVSTTKNHALTRVDELSDASPQPQTGHSDEVRAPMCRIHNLAVEFYCEEHNTPVCKTCTLLEHRSCDLEDIESAASIGVKGKTLEALYQMREIDSQMKKLRGILGNEQEGLESQKSAIIEKITSKMKEIEVLGQMKIAEVEGVFKQERDNLDKETRALTQSNLLVVKGISELERVTQVGSDEEIFVATKQAENEFQTFQDIVYEYGQVTNVELNFEIDNRLLEITSVGDVCVEKSRVSVDLSPELKEVLNIECSTKIPCWIDMLPDGHLILLSYEQNEESQLSLYSDSKTLLSQLMIPGVLSAAILNDHQLILPVVNAKQFQIVHIDDDKLTKGSIIAFDLNPLLVLKYTDSSILTLSLNKNWEEENENKEEEDNEMEKNDDGEEEIEYCFVIVDLTSQKQRHTKVSKSLLLPNYMRMSNEKNEIYVVDVFKGCFGFNLNGDVIFEFSCPFIFAYCGLAIDLYGALYVGVTTGEGLCIIKLTPTGYMIKHIDKEMWPLNCVQNKLYAAGENDQEDTVICCIEV